MGSTVFDSWKAASDGVRRGCPQAAPLTFRLDRLGGIPWLIDVKFSIAWNFGNVTGRRVHRLVSHDPPLMRKDKSIIVRAIYHKPATNNDDVIKIIKRAVGGFVTRIR